LFDSWDVLKMNIYTSIKITGQSKLPLQICIILLIFCISIIWYVSIIITISSTLHFLNNVFYLMLYLSRHLYICSSSIYLRNLTIELYKLNLIDTKFTRSHCRRWGSSHLTPRRAFNFNNMICLNNYYNFIYITLPQQCVLFNVISFKDTHKFAS
jgi:hypothetical protein